MNKKMTAQNEDAFGGKQTSETGLVGGEPTPSEPDTPKPPEIPSVDRTTGKVAGCKSCEEPQLDGWINSEDPDETFNMGPDYCRPGNRKPHSGYGFVV